MLPGFEIVRSGNEGHDENSLDDESDDPMNPAPPKLVF